MTCVVLENWCAWLYPEEEKLLLLLGKLEESIDYYVVHHHFIMDVVELHHVAVNVKP